MNDTESAPPATRTSSSRRAVLRAGLTACVASGFAAAAARAQSTPKLAQNVVQYQQTPKDGNKCSGCVNFIAPSSCKIVDGTINPDGWCVAYAPKTG